MAEQKSGCGSIVVLIVALYLVSKCFGGAHEERQVAASSSQPAPLTRLADSSADASTSYYATPADEDEDDATEAGETSDVDEAEDEAADSTAGETYGSSSYIDVDGHQVSSPVYASSAPDGATAKCYDGTYSFSHHRRGTCSHHGGVAEWL